LDEAADLVRVADDQWALSQICFYRALAAGSLWGDPGSAQAAAVECRDLADALGDRCTSWNVRTWLGIALEMQGALDEAGQVVAALVDEGRRPATRR
jgi:hypothetical protein